MKEIIGLYLGQGGVQIASAVWELFGAEHGICVNGTMNQDVDNRGVDRFFYINTENQCLPRCVLVDLDPIVIDEIRTGCYQNFFGPGNLLSGFEDSASIFSRGYFTLGRLYLNKLMEKFNQQIEMADSIQGFVFMHSMGGGTGSGLYSLVLEELDGYNKTSKIDISVHPSFPSSPIVVEPYNTVLAEHYTIDETDISFMVDNEALFRIANKNLQFHHPSYATINRIVAQAFSSITSASRFGDHSSTINEVLHNVVPYPRIHFPTCSISPINNSDIQIHSFNTTYSITKEALSNESQLLNCFPDEGKYMTCCLMYKGNINTGDIHDAIAKLKCYENLQFVDWCPTGIKVTLCSQTPTYIAKSGIAESDKMLTIVSNNSSITDPMLHNTFRFQVLFQKRSFVHWYVGEGMEEEEFKDSLENMACLIKDYDECSLSTRLLVDNPNLEAKVKQKKTKEKQKTLTQKPEEKEQQSFLNESYIATESNRIKEINSTNDIKEANENSVANDNNFADDDWVSSIQQSESYEKFLNNKQ